MLHNRQNRNYPHFTGVKADYVHSSYAEAAWCRTKVLKRCWKDRLTLQLCTCYIFRVTDFRLLHLYTRTDRNLPLKVTVVPPAWMTWNRQPYAWDGWCHLHPSLLWISHDSWLSGACYHSCLHLLLLLFTLLYLINTARPTTCSGTSRLCHLGREAEEEIGVSTRWWNSVITGSSLLPEKSGKIT